MIKLRFVVSKIRWSHTNNYNPLGKIAEKAVCMSVFL